MKAFWRDHPMLRLPFPACKACRGSVPGASCGLRKAAEAGAVLEDAFHHLLSALWLDPASVGDAYEEFRHLSLRAPGASEEAHAAYCFFVELADAQIERRGAYWRWSHRDVETVIALACEAVVELEQRRASSKQASSAPGGAADELRDKLSELHLSTQQPFIGCAACHSRCFHRYDMEMLPLRGHIEDFREGGGGGGITIISRQKHLHIIAMETTAMAGGATDEGLLRG